MASVQLPLVGVLLAGIAAFGAHQVLADDRRPVASKPAVARASAMAQAPGLRIAGAPEIVLPASEMRCATARGIDVPDLPPSAFRRSDGRVVLIASNRQNFLASGPSLDKIKRDGCEKLLTLAGNADPSQFRDQEWVTGVMPLSASKFLGVVHNEYHGELRDTQRCPRREADKLCWYASSTLITSNDGGRSFVRPPAPTNVLAAPLGRYEPGRERVSLSVPKIVRRGQYLYVLSAFSDRNRNLPIQQCLFRARVDAPLDWRAWDGKGFGLQRGSAYRGTSGGDCVGVLKGNATSVKFSTARNEFVALVVDRDSIDYATSPDLIRWSAKVPIRGLSPFGRYDAKQGPPDWYFSLLDPTSRSPGFDTLESRPYLYFVRFHTSDGRIVRRARDVMRQRIDIR